MTDVNDLLRRVLNDGERWYTTHPSRQAGGTMMSFEEAHAYLDGLEQERSQKYLERQAVINNAAVGYPGLEQGNETRWVNRREQDDRLDSLEASRVERIEKVLRQYFEAMSLRTGPDTPPRTFYGNLLQQLDDLAHPSKEETPDVG